MNLFVCYEKCSTCKKAENFLKENDISYEKRDIKTENPQKDELYAWYKKSGLPLKRLFNTSGNLYKEMQLKDRLSSMSEKEQLDLLSQNGMLVKRPVLVTKDHVFFGFKQEEYEKLKG